jgi:hypothetical protein
MYNTLTLARELSRSFRTSNSTPTIIYPKIHLFAGLTNNSNTIM